jgi:hypothetical protein
MRSMPICTNFYTSLGAAWNSKRAMPDGLGICSDVVKSATLQSGTQLGKVPNVEGSGAQDARILDSVQHFEGGVAI